MGILLGFIFQWAYNACHECLHRTFVKSKKVNEFLGVLLSTITILNFNMFKTYHLQHHANTFGEYETEPIEKNIGSFGEYLLNFIVLLQELCNLINAHLICLIFNKQPYNFSLLTFHVNITIILCVNLHIFKVCYFHTIYKTISSPY